MEVSPSWSSLADDLLIEIFNHLNNSLDLLRCHSVCVSWQSVASAVNSDHTHTPLLLVLNRQDGICSLYDILTENNKPEVIDLSIQNRWICNSISNGWLLAVDLSSPYRVSLSNPISKDDIFLPSATTLSTFHRERIPGFIKKGIASTSDSLEIKDCVVVVIYGLDYSERKIAFCRPGDGEWRNCDAESEISFLDIMLYKGKFYAADTRGEIYGCDLASGDMKIVFIIDPPVYVHHRHKYLVESKSGDILMIYRNWKWVEEEEEGIASSFEVYKVDLSKKEWKKIENLGEEALFVGGNSTGIGRSIKVTELKERGISNSICYIHDSIEGGSGDEDGYGGLKSASIYDMETGKSKRLCTSESWASYQFHWFNI